MEPVKVTLARSRRSADRRVDRAADKTGTGFKNGQPMGGHRSTGADERLCECARVC